MPEFIVRDDGLLGEKSIAELAAWYDKHEGAPENFEAHLTLLRAYAALISSAQRGRRVAITIERFSLLRLLYRSPNRRLLLGDISRGLNVSPASVSKLVNGLVRLRLVQRIGYTGDKRRAWAQLTDEGAQIVEDYIPGFREATKRRWQGLTRAEKRMLVHLLSKLLLSLHSASAERELRHLETTTPVGDQQTSTEAV